MVVLTILEARHVLSDLEVMDERYEEDLSRAIEIMEESLHNTQEIEIPDGKGSDIPPSGDTNTQVV